MDFTADLTWFRLAAFLYTAGFALGTFALWRDRRQSRGTMYAIVLLGYTLHTFALYLRGMEVKGCPLGNAFEIYQFTAWSAITLYLVVGVAFRLSLLGYFTSLLAAALSLVSLSFPSWDASRRIGAFGGNAWIEFHAALALFSYGVFALLALTGLMLLLRHISLKSKHLGGAFAFLPSILDLDQISLRLLITGVSLLAASLAVGAIYWLQALDSVHLPKLIITFTVWLAYVAVLSLRLRGLLVAKRFAWTCLLLFFVALLSLGPVNSSRQPQPAAPATSAP